MLKKLKIVLIVLLLLTAYRGASQIAIDSVCFDIDIAKRIESDLIDLDAYRAAEPYQLSVISDLQRLNSNKDSIILNLNAQLSIQRDITVITGDQAKFQKKGDPKWMKWLFMLAGAGGTFLILR